MTSRFLILTVFVMTACLWTQDAGAGATESSYRQARTLIDQSIARMDVSDWLVNPTPLLIEVDGHLDSSAEHQALRSGTPSYSPYRETWAWDPSSGRIVREFRQTHPDGREEWVREVFESNDQAWRLDLLSGKSGQYSGPGVTARRDRLQRRFPPMLLQEALGHAEALRFTGRFGPFDSVQIQTNEQESLSLFFGRESHHLGSVEYLTDLPTFGDSTVSWKFADYRPVTGIGELPHHISVHINDIPYSELTVSRVSRNPVTVEAFLARVAQPEALAHRSGPRLETLAGGVHRIADLGPDTHMLVLEFEDHLVVLDAPAARPLLHELPAGMVSHARGESALSRTALRILQDAMPHKPVRQLVISHFHSDSAGGLLAFSELHMDILASSDQSAAIEDFLQKSHTLCELEARTENLHLHPIKERHVISDASQHVEILQVGPNPHSENMLVAWLPRSGILWAGDLQRGLAGRPDPRQVSLNRFFEQWLDRQDIEPELILTKGGDGEIRQGDSLRVDAQHTHNLPRDP